MFPLGMVVFPHQIIALVVFEDRYHGLLADIEETSLFGTCLIARGSEVGGGDERTSVGTLLEVVMRHEIAPGHVLVKARGLEAFKVVEWLEDNPYPRARVEERCCDDVRIEPDLLKTSESAVRALRALQSEIHPDEKAVTNLELDNYDPWLRAWQLNSLTPMSLDDQFAILAESNPNNRLRMLSEICCTRYGMFQQQLADN
jgi:uncharacterized protein